MTGTDKLTEVHQRMTEAVEALTSGAEWRAMLDVARRFHSYSAGNVLLIMAQRPDATRVAGYRRWQSLGRQVRRGERGIAILAPCTRKVRDDNDSDTDSGEERDERMVLTGFKVVHVFDESQTEGEPLPDVRPAVLEGDAPAALRARLEELVDELGFTFGYGECPGFGRTDFGARRVILRPGLPTAQEAKTLTHEIAHVLLHERVTYLDYLACRGRAEVEAESVAYLVCGAAGLATGNYSFPYVAGWSGGDMTVVRDATEKVVACAHTILGRLGLVDEALDAA